MLKHIPEDDIFRWRLKYVSTGKEDNGQLQPKHSKLLQVPSAAARQAKVHCRAQSSRVTPNLIRLLPRICRSRDTFKTLIHCQTMSYFNTSPTYLRKLPSLLNTLPSTSPKTKSVSATHLNRASVDQKTPNSAQLWWRTPLGFTIRQEIMTYLDTQRVLHIFFPIFPPTNYPPQTLSVAAWQTKVRQNHKWAGRHFH